MVTLSPRAAKAILNTLNERNAGRDEGIRVEQKDGDLTLTIDSVRDGDRAVKYFGSTLLIVNEGLEEKIGEAVVDVDEGPQGEQVVVRR